MLLLLVADSHRFAAVERSNMLMPFQGQSGCLGAYQYNLNAIHCNFARNSSRSEYSDERERRRHCERCYVTPNSRIPRLT